MRKAALLIVVQAVTTGAVLAALHSGAMPLGVPGEWEWQRLPRTAVVSPVSMALGAAGVAIYATAAGLVLWSLGPAPSWRKEAAALAGLIVAAVAVQLVVTASAADGYGLTKWAMALHTKGSSGYYTVAKGQIGDPWQFLSDYPQWIRRQDALHIGTHPPGLFLVAHGMLRGMEAHPEVARTVVEHLPRSVEQGFQVIAQYDPLPRADRAALGATGALTLLACAATVLPLYLLARAAVPAQAAWAAAALWPLAPSTVLFQPAADTAFPLLSATALALAAHAGRRPGRSALPLAAGVGVVLAVGMSFTLAFLAVGLVAGLILAASPARSGRGRLAAIAATGSAFLAVVLLGWLITRANPFVVWWWNQHNHARFYVEYPRSYLAWMAANPLELAVGLGIPTVCAVVVGLVPLRSVPRATLATLAVLALLTVSGKNLSEVARLWLLLMPPLCVTAGHALARAGRGPWLLGASALLTGLQTLILEAMIQVVYPV